MRESFEDAQAEIVRRIKRYRHAPTLPALHHRLKGYIGNEDAVDQCVMALMRGGRLRCTNKLFHLPTPWDDFFSSLG